MNEKNLDMGEFLTSPAGAKFLGLMVQAMARTEALSREISATVADAREAAGVYRDIASLLEQMAAAAEEYAHAN